MIVRRLHPLTWLGGSILLGWCIAALFAPLLAPYSPTANYMPLVPAFEFGADGHYFLLGTDHLGRDILSRTLFGARTVLLFVPLATFAGYLVGTLAGLAAGYLRGWTDEMLSRGAELILAFPAIVLYVAIVGRFGASPATIVAAVAFAIAPAVMRLVRGLTLEIRGRAYVSAAEIRGEPLLWILFVEILPNARGPIIVDFALRLGYTTIAIGTLGFLGIGLPPPNPDWGGMINEGRQFAMAFPHTILAPCLAVSSFVLGCNLVADGLRAGERS